MVFNMHNHQLHPLAVSIPSYGRHRSKVSARNIYTYHGALAEFLTYSIYKPKILASAPPSHSVCYRRASSMAPEIPKAEYKQLGKSGLRVSVPILGAMSFGDKRWQPFVIFLHACPAQATPHHAYIDMTQDLCSGIYLYAQLLHC